MDIGSHLQNENERIAALYQLQILDTVPEEDFDDIVNLASQICQTPISIIAFVDEQRSWFKAKVGVDCNEIPRDIAFSTIGLQSKDLFILSDAREDERFNKNPLVKNENGIRFFACIPLINDEGFALGHLCVVDRQPKTLSPHQISSLRILGKQVVTLLKLRLQIIKMRKAEEDALNTTNKLDQQKEFYENILNNLPVDIAIFDSEHRYLFVNPGGIKKEEYRKFIIGKDDFQYCEYRNRDVSLAKLRRERFLEMKRTQKEARWEDTVVNDGNPVTNLRRFFPVYDDNGLLTMVIGLGLDISDRKMLEEKQSALVKQLSAQNTQLIDFCNIVSHNLRAPLVNMSMLAEFIQESEDMEEQKSLIAKLNPVLENLHVTFNELVESIQIRQDIEIRSERISLKECMQRTLDTFEVEINKSEAEIDANFDEAAYIYYPVKYLFSIFHNLVSNALKYHSPKRKPVIHLETKRSGRSIILIVKDNGLGINLLKHKDNIFKIGKVFHRHPNAKGFGLFMTKTHVEAMDGRIWVESIPDEGSTFFIEFTNQY